MLFLYVGNRGNRHTVQLDILEQWAYSCPVF